MLIALVVIAALAQTVAEKPGPNVLRVARHLACLCGCNDTVATCSMLDCHFSKPAKEKIARMQAAGMSDQAIIDQFIAENGPGIYRADPSPFGWIVPYVGLGAGLALLWVILRRYYRKPAVAAAGAPEDPALARYAEQIDKDLDRLDTQ
ncbi:MAG: cytochrome c-type biogenesis protein CcmH [Bryobacteraceae bacterium]